MADRFTTLLRRSILFVSALLPQRLSDAARTGADIVCLDLEDAVPPGRKAEARSAAMAALRGGGDETAQIAARINSLRSREGVRDILTCLELEHGQLGALVLPKVESSDEVRWAGALADEAGSRLDLYAIVETSAGLENCAEIATSHPRLKALFFGGFDLSTALGCAMDWGPLLYARSRVVHAAAMAGIEALDSPYPDVENLRGLRFSAEQARSLGMAGKATKAAAQIPVIAEVFTPRSDEVTRARKILELFDADPTKPVVFDGKLIELPTIKRLRRIGAFESAPPAL